MTPDSTRALAQFAGVSARTARRWQRTGLPSRWHGLAGLLAGDLGAVAPAWSGWTVTAGGLTSPEGWTFTPGELRAIPTEYQLRRALERDVAALRLRLDVVGRAALTGAASPAPGARPASAASPSVSGPWPSATSP